MFGNNALASVPVLNVDRVLYLLVAGFLAIRVLRQPKSLQPLGHMEKVMGIYLTVVLLSWVTTLPDKDLVSFKQDADFLLTCFLMPFTAFLVARNTEWTRERITWCLWVLVGGVGTYLVVIGILQYAYGWDFFTPQGVKNIHTDRATGPFNNSLPYGMVLSIIQKSRRARRSRGRRAAPPSAPARR